MRTRKLSFNIQLLLSLMLIAAGIIAAPVVGGSLIASPESGWPQWRGPRRDAVSTETGLLQTWPAEGPPLLWKIDGIGRGWSSPIIVDSRLYITGDADGKLVIFAFDTNGKPLWQVQNGNAWKNPYPGARATCTFSEGKVYHMNAHGRVACLDAATGGELWALNILEHFDAKNITWALSECLLVDGPRLIVTPAGPKALMAALDKNTGRVLWTTPPLPEEKTSHCSPILFEHAGRRVISNCSASFGFGVDAETGRLLWTVPLKNRFGTNISIPAYNDGAIYYVTPYAELGRRYNLTPTDDAFTAQHLWTCPLDTVTGCSLLVDNVLYAAGYNAPKWWFAVDWPTGETLAELKDFTTGTALYADNRLYILDESGQVGLIEPAKGALNIKGRFSLTEKKVKDAWAHPVILDGRLYLRYHDTLFCYDLKRP
ncbi:MAG: PQQ-binding-like beta-propeller repeat protein [Phycisphaerae bacterium]|nr:PQQ-binding-like beta-propeller repeat protein [Phycisphaerae bacterium]